MRRFSITELDMYQNCPMAHYHRYVQGLRLKPELEDEDSPRNTGRAVARAIEVGVTLRGGLQAALATTDDRGAQVAIRHVPGWVWGVPRPVAEDKLEVAYPGDIMFVGVPDLWYVEEDATAVHVVEFKSGSDTGYRAGQKLERYETWGIQAVRYAVLLHDAYDWLQHLPFYRRHVYLSTKGNAVEGAQILVSAYHMDNARRDMLAVADTITHRQPDRHFGPLCDYCDYASISFAYLTGGPPDDIITEQYEVSVDGRH